MGKRILGKYILRPLKPSEVPNREKFKNIAVHILTEFYNMEEKHVEISSKAEPLEKKELVQLYEALKLVCDVDKMNVEVRTEEGRLFLSKRQ